MKLILYSMVVLGLFTGYSSSTEGKDASGSKPAHLLLSKQVQNKYLVEGMDIVVKYAIYNIGEQPAVDVQVKEVGFPEDSFDVVSGHASFKLDRIPPHSNNTHTLVVRPKKFGYFNFTSAEVKYRVSDEADDIIQTGASSDPGHGVIISLKNYDKQFSAHILDWIAFAVITLPPLGVPFMLWYSSKSKYESIMRASKRD
ncbi:translocon-associated protein subunit beta [Lepeophtheirus salmonis]|uniref:Translocon-associated protein subunit beta n=1 Tax=Lepeophtheirus salmonis TaxID=72036 RepID=C1BT04_LEPSM|nr:translocon-associated protein subunit beta-like [Lepeophtheirus salmonis]ACO12157.1 Translocon-associated protein subunit beta precursor [Lepeophtheirus salmonis]ACO13171.1 Translocon-associated protein subunit beta precursor [Lepeophtheirus salmonis]